MALATESDNLKENSENTIIKEEIKLHIHWYLITFFIIYFSSFLIPSVIFMLFIMWLYLPNFLEVSSLITIFTNSTSLLVSITFPLIIIICYLIHLFMVALVARLFWNYTEKKSPTKSGIIPRNIPSKTLNFYHGRSFMIKYPKNAFSRGPFPWLLNWMYNFVGSNFIGKGSVVEEQLAGDRFVEIGENCYIGTNTGMSSHAVEGIFGNVSQAKIKLRDNFTGAAFSIIGPGTDTGEHSHFLPMTATTKYNVLKGNNYYFGIPARKIFKKRLMNYLQISEDDLKRAEDLKKKLKSLDRSRKKKRVSKLNE